jgi:putative transposase
MKRSRFSDEQIIGILKEHQVGLSATEWAISGYA